MAATAEESIFLPRLAKDLAAEGREGWLSVSKCLKALVFGVAEEEEGVEREWEEEEYEWEQEEKWGEGDGVNRFNPSCGGGGGRSPCDDGVTDAGPFFLPFLRLLLLLLPLPLLPPPLALPLPLPPQLLLLLLLRPPSARIFSMHKSPTSPKSPLSRSPYLPRELLLPAPSRWPTPLPPPLPLPPPPPPLQLPLPSPPPLLVCAAVTNAARFRDAGVEGVMTRSLGDTSDTLPRESFGGS